MTGVSEKRMGPSLLSSIAVLEAVMVIRLVAILVLVGGRGRPTCAAAGFGNQILLKCSCGARRSNVPNGHAFVK
jgi:hypothetical protein